MRRFFLSALAAFALVFGIRALVRALASDETRIRWQLEDMAEGFNETSMNACLAGLAPEFLDETYGADRALVRQALAYIFFQRKDPVTKGFLYRVELPREALKIDVAISGETADVELTARFFEKRGDQERLAWETKIDADLIDFDGDWLVVRSEHVTLAGQLLR